MISLAAVECSCVVKDCESLAREREHPSPARTPQVSAGLHEATSLPWPPWRFRIRSGAHSHTTPSPSPSRMYRYAGCERGTGAIPCRRASLHVILPLRLSS